MIIFRCVLSFGSLFLLVCALRIAVMTSVIVGLQEIALRSRPKPKWANLIYSNLFGFWPLQWFLFTTKQWVAYLEKKAERQPHEKDL